jgi:hypothetical protein
MTKVPSKAADLKEFGGETEKMGGETQGGKSEVIA